MSSHWEECESLHDSGIGLNLPRWVRCAEDTGNQIPSNHICHDRQNQNHLYDFKLEAKEKGHYICYMILTVFAKVWRSIHAEFARAASLLQAGVQCCIKGNLFVDAGCGKIWWSLIRDDSLQWRKWFQLILLSPPKCISRHLCQGLSLKFKQRHQMQTNLKEPRRTGYSIQRRVASHTNLE